MIFVADLVFKDERRHTVNLSKYTPFTRRIFIYTRCSRTFEHLNVNKTEDRHSSLGKNEINISQTKQFLIKSMNMYFKYFIDCIPICNPSD